jgi:hypothetical protein
MYTCYKGKFTLEQAMKAQRRSSFTLSLTSALDGVGGQDNDPAALPPRKGPGTQRTGPFCTGAENLVLTGMRSPDRQGHSESLYRLSYPFNQN